MATYETEMSIERKRKSSLRLLLAYLTKAQCDEYVCMFDCSLSH